MARPKQNSKPWLTCPVSLDTKEIERLSTDMTKTLKKLRHDLIACSYCAVGHPTCPIVRSFHATINSAIAEIAIEWDLQPKPRPVPGPQ
jgi:Na+-translocating ferredoxin:NAD+ oxidoreductase RnfC subunit